MKNNTYKLDRDKFSVPIDLPTQFHEFSRTFAAYPRGSHRLCANGQIVPCLKIHITYNYLFSGGSGGGW